jgi:hypothetical protein
MNVSVLRSMNVAVACSVKLAVCGFGSVVAAPLPCPRRLPTNPTAAESLRPMARRIEPVNPTVADWPLPIRRVRAPAVSPTVAATLRAVRRATDPVNPTVAVSALVKTWTACGGERAGEPDRGGEGLGEEVDGSGGVAPGERDGRRHAVADPPDLCTRERHGG